MNRSPVLVAVLLLAACRGTEGAHPAASGVQNTVVPGRYATDSLAAADAGGRMVILELKSDSTAVLQTEWPGKTDTRRGRFSASGPDLRAEFPAQDSAPPMQFRWRLITTRLVPVDWDRAIYGPAGLTLHLR